VAVVTAAASTLIGRMSTTIGTKAGGDPAPVQASGRDSSSSPWARLPLGAKILLPVFAMTLVTALAAGAFFTSAEVVKDRVLQADEGKAIAVMVKGALVPVPDDPSSTAALLRGVSAAYANVAALCVLAVNHDDPLGPLVVYASSGPAAACDAGSPLAPGLGIRGVISGLRQTATGSVEETVTQASFSSIGQAAVIVVQVRLTPFADLAVPLFEKAAGTGLLLSVVQTWVVYGVLSFWALRPLKQLRLRASAAARTARPEGIAAPSRSGDEIHDLSLRFDEMLGAVQERELEILQSRDRLDTLITHSPVMVFAVDREGVLLEVQGKNVAAMAERAGRDTIKGLNLLHFLEGNPGFTLVIQRALAGEKVHEVVAIRNWATVAPSSEEIHLDVLMTPSRDGDGRLIGATGLAVNISDRMDAASARAESQQKSAFLAAMSHELRTPLNSIMGFSQLLEMPASRAVLTRKQQRYVKHIYSSGEHLLALVSDILDMAKVGAGQMEVNLEPVAVDEALKDPVDTVRPLAAGKGLKIEVHVPSDLTSFTDRLRVRQILLNLLTNAVKFTEPNGGPIVVSGRSSGDGIEIAVTDAGIGIALDDQLRIFEEFTQVDRGPRRRLDGTGLGLALTKRMVELVGGSIRVDSKLGSGSTFTVWLPSAAPSSASPQLAGSHAA
jgi:signal transduction histidine kinase